MPVYLGQVNINLDKLRGAKETHHKGLNQLGNWMKVKVTFTEHSSMLGTVFYTYQLNFHNTSMR